MSNNSTSNDSPDPSRPKNVTIDNQSVSQHDLKSQLDAADRADAAKALRRKGLGIMRRRMTPGDAV
ncbi:hypothetical protein [Allorhodopirellula heiligendammensis]|uniref:hypothetical protein n=1 Tax=Allorhodopirellula heiligendammensis TaxID=2714739 RepID=UPI0011B7E86F|nr:hypothetical protein [Allorhodopirellula heiligendammensis]